MILYLKKAFALPFYLLMDHMCKKHEKSSKEAQEDRLYLFLYFSESNVFINSFILFICTYYWYPERNCHWTEQ